MSLTTIIGTIVATSSAAVLLKFWKQPKQNAHLNIAALREKCESPIEEMVFDELVRRDIIPHPQYVIGNYRLDFAISPTHLKINVECDGKDYHDYWPQIEKDRQRNTYLANKGWAVLRFSGRQIHKDIRHCGKVIEQTVEERKKQLKNA